MIYETVVRDNKVETEPVPRDKSTQSPHKLTDKYVPQE